MVFTLQFVLVDVALAVVYFEVVAGSTVVLFVGGLVVFAFALVGVYLFFDAMGCRRAGGHCPCAARSCRADTAAAGVPAALISPPQRCRLVG